MSGFNSNARNTSFLSPNKTGSAGSAAAPANGGNRSPKTATESNVRPISTLNPYQRNWTIKARVTSKSDIRQWNKGASSQGKLFSVDLVDADGGQIRATMFNQTADKFHPVFEEKRVYLISRGSLKTANTKFNKLPHEYEITLGDDSEVVPMEDTQDIKQQQYVFVSIGDLEQIQKDANIDVLGVVTAIGQVGEITTKTTQKQLKRRNLTLVDRSAKSVELTMWGDQADQYNEHTLGGNPVVAFKGVRVSDYSNRTLSTSFQTKIVVAPQDLPEAQQLRAWFDGEGKDAKLETMSRRDGSSAGADGKATVRKTFSAIKDEHLGRTTRAGYDNSKGDYFEVRGTVVYYNVNPQKPPWYLACGLPTPNNSSKTCQKKVNSNDASGSGGYRCETCNKNVPKPEPRFLLSVLCCDHTGGHWLTAFNEQAEKLVQKSARECKQILERDGEEAFKGLFMRQNFAQYVFKIRAQEDTGPQGGGGGDGMSEGRVRCSVTRVEPVQYAMENNKLVADLESVLGAL